MPQFFIPPASYHERSFDRQKSDITASVLEKAGVSTATCVLDLGCGAGQTLRVVRGFSESAVLIGVDPDGSALMSGLYYDGRVQFIQGESERLPIADCVASHVICRVSINYMHQARVVREMSRTLASTGRIIVSFIAPGYALRQVFWPESPGIRQRLGNLKDLVAGVILQISGYQPARRTFLGRSVPYTSTWRLRRQLREVGCEITWLGHEARFLGIPTVSWAIVVRACKNEHEV